MPDIFQSLSQYFWAVALAFSGFNYARASRRLEAITAQSAELTDGKKYLQRFAIATASPWVAMGVGQLTGATPTIWHYFRPQDGNLFVWAWLGLSFALACLYAWWVFFADGANKVRNFNLMAVLGQQASKPPSVLSVKFFAALGPIMFPVWLYLVVSHNVPLPP